MLHAQIMDCFTRAGIDVRVVQEATRALTMLSLVSAGLRRGIAAAIDTAPFLPGGSLRRDRRRDPAEPVPRHGRAAQAAASSWCAACGSWP